MKKKLLFTFLTLFIIISCKVDENNNKNPTEEDNKIIEEKILQLEQDGKIPSNLDRTSYLLGVDANNNGVRDDVEKWIEQKYPNQIPEAMQFARAKQIIMGLDIENELELRKADLEETRAIRCLGLKEYKLQSQGVETVDVDILLKQVSAITKNTKERIQAELRYAKALNGSVLAKTKDEDACDE